MFSMRVLLRLRRARAKFNTGARRARSYSVALSRRMNFEDDEYWEEKYHGEMSRSSPEAKLLRPTYCSCFCIRVTASHLEGLKGIVLFDACAEAARKRDAKTGREAWLITIVDKYGQPQEEELHFEDRDHLAAWEDCFDASVAHVRLC